ncbi:photosystem reaction center subunit H [Streptomyces tateyamensis]|uniref:Photosystem reaction center subunit H n=1 Tax=Streptomyces tateyamensis TaxID=565073 RepID=A0A2V4MVC6_9ACTN|nr:PRC-barrel domain-containing protein [Streptomyces tateyamensis]PYC70202.1 photosystem reaction center subunit H [Streptomyces tateyamensis]
MITIGDIREWRNHDVVDTAGKKIGSLEAIYVDTATDEPAMATVEVGMLTNRRLVFVPLADAVVGPGYLRVNYSKAQVKEAPSIGTDDILPAEAEEGVYRHYGLEYRAGVGGERRLARP